MQDSSYLEAAVSCLLFFVRVAHKKGKCERTTTHLSYHLLLKDSL